MAEDDFLNFRKLVSTSIIKGVYVTGAVLICIAGMIWIAYPFATHYARPDPGELPVEAFAHVAGGFSLLTVGNLIWRLACEGWILLFSVHEMIASIEKSSTATTQLLEEVTRQIAGLDSNAEQRHQEALSRPSVSPKPLSR